MRTPTASMKLNKFLSKKKITHGYCTCVAEKTDYADKPSPCSLVLGVPASSIPIQSFLTSVVYALFRHPARCLEGPPAVFSLMMSMLWGWDLIWIYENIPRAPL